MANYTPSQDVLSYLVDYENPNGPFLTAEYDDIGKVWTIGYGHTGSDVYEGLTITPEQSLDLYRQDLSWVVNTINSSVIVDLTQNQFDALVSLVYNIEVQVSMVLHY